MTNARSIKRKRSFLAKALWCALLLVSLTVENGLAGGRFNVPITPIAQITIDDEGDSLEYPYTVFYDPVVEETYIVNVGSSRVVVYGPDYFPRVSIGRGRGVAAPISGAVLSNGDVYVGQVKNKVSKSNRITILNGAFFPKKEINLDDIPEVAGFYPSQFAVNRDGKIYLTGDAGLGVLVLDNDGRFLHRVQPIDKIDYLEMLQEWAGLEEEIALNEEQEEGFPIKAKETSPVKKTDPAKTPEKNRRPDPFKELRSRPKDSEGNYPVRINHVSIDSEGRLYLLSPETSKVYVYDFDENFIFSFGERGGTPGKLSQPKSMAIDEKRQLIYIADYMRHSILVYRMFTGEYLFEFGGRGAAPGWFNFPNGLAINSQDQLLVADYFNQRIQVLDVGFDEPPPLAKDGSSPRPATEPSDNLDAAEADALVPDPNVDTVEGTGQRLDQDND
jgi:DNA-binding beta-propeller fold protein YncE